MNSNPTIAITWQQFDDLSQAVGKQIADCRFNAEAIVGIERSGLIPAVYLAHLLAVRDFYSISIRRTVSDLPYAPKVPPIIGSTDLIQVKGKRVLIVDDIIHLGLTFQAARNIIISKGAEDFRLVALVKRLVEREIEPDFVGMAASAWVDFPWNKTLL